MLVVGVFVFLLIHLTPGGDPADVIGGPYATKEQVDEIRESLGLDRPMVVQFWTWFSRVLRGDLGDSMFSSKPVTALLAARVDPSLSLALLAEIIAVGVGVPLGVLAAWKANTLVDRAVMVFAATGFSIPIFWLGYNLIWLFSLKLEILPVLGYVSLEEARILSFLEHLALPSLCLGIVLTALIARMTRASVLEVLREDYIRTARAKGLSERLVLVRHALRAASLPTVTTIGLGIAWLLTGAVITETVFAIPGVGRLTVDAIVRRDYPVIQGVVMVVSAVYVFINLAVDLVYAILDPRIRY